MRMLQQEEKRRQEAAQKNIVEEVVLTQPEGFTVDRILTKEERIAAIQELISSIPVEKEEMWAWEIKSQFIDDVVLANTRLCF